MSQFSSIEEARDFFRKDLYATENGIVLDEYTENGSVCSVELTDRHRNAEGGAFLADAAADGQAEIGSRLDVVAVGDIQRPG